jgi:hypothetical protein
VITLISACNNDQTATVFDAEQTKSEVGLALDSWHLNAAEARFLPYFDLFSKKGIYIGTDASENWTVDEFKAFSKPYFDKGKAWSFRATHRNIYLAKDNTVAWFDELLDTWMGICRGSGVFQKQNGKWALEHYVLSLTVPNERMDSVIAVIGDKK